MDQKEMNEEEFEMWINANLSFPAFTLFGSQNDNVESQLCSELSRMMIRNHYQGIGITNQPQQQQQQQQGFMNINTTPTPSWFHNHFQNNLVTETEPIGPPRAKRTFQKEQGFGESQVDSFPNINFGNSGFFHGHGRGWGYQRTQLQNQSFESLPHVGPTSFYYLFSPPPPPLAFECDDNSYIILMNETKQYKCRSRRNCFDGESSKNSGIDFKQQKQQGKLSYEELVRLQGLNMFEKAKDQNGCRELQNSFDGDNIQNMEVVFNGIIDYVVPLMMDPFGNYLVQKLLDFCFDYQRLKLVLMLTKEPGLLVTISLDTHGTRVVQKLIKTIKTNMEIQLVRSAIQPYFLELIRDLNGNHVIQSCLLCLSVQDNEFIFDAATKLCVKAATHQQGCCVLKRCIEYSKRRSQDKLVKEICKHGLQLAGDAYGNYVVQSVMEMENLSNSAKFTLISQFEGNYVDLSKQKFSSHIVETCLKYIPESRSSIVHEFLSAEDFEHLMQHPFANYVIQCALLVTKGQLHRSLAEAVRQHKKLHTSPYCKKIFSKHLLRK